MYKKRHYYDINLTLSNYLQLLLEPSKRNRVVQKQRSNNISKTEFTIQSSFQVSKKIHEDVHPTSSKDAEASSDFDNSTSDKESYVRCDECSKLFRNLQHLESHKNRSHNAETKECKQCGRWCKNLLQHEKVFHNSEAILARAMYESKDGVESCSSATDDLLDRCKTKYYQCDHCSKVFTTKYIHDNELFSKLGERKFV